jgi:hypothetical protein
MSKNLKVLKLYKNLLKESSKFTNYNFRYRSIVNQSLLLIDFIFFFIENISILINNLFREYAIRKIKVEFRENLSEKNPINIENLLSKANDSLNLIKRQVLRDYEGVFKLISI